MTEAATQHHLLKKQSTGVHAEEFEKNRMQVLYDDDNIREVLLMDQEYNGRVYTIIMKNKEWQQSEEISEVNKAIQNGERIEKAFATRGYSIRKNILSVYTMPLPEWLRIVFATASENARACITSFTVKKHNQTFNYGIITEIFSPAYKEPGVSAEDERQINIPPFSLLKPGFSKEEIWASLEHKTLSPHLPGYSPVAAEIKEKIHSMMMEALPILGL